MFARKYFILCGMRVVKSVCSHCPNCLCYSSRCSAQQVASLLIERLRFEFLFATTGLDYAVAIKVMPSRGRVVTSTKGYICIFICLVTRAVHVEIVSDLTSICFLSALDRFVNRRNLSRVIYSDNATTFQGAGKEIRSKLFSERSPDFR